MHSFMKPFIYLIKSIVASIIMATLLLIAAYSLPLSPIREHARESIPIYTVYSNESDAFFWAPYIRSTVLDFFTESLMINSATYLGTGSVIKDSMNNSYIIYEDSPTKIDCMIRAISDNSLDKSITVEYPRYWHGYLIWLKPLLYIMNISDIRVLFVFLQLFLLGFVVIELHQSGGYRISIPYLITILALNPISTSLSLDYSSMYFIILISSIVLVLTKLYNTENYWHLFLWVGISTAFFDFLTFPISGLGLNLLIMISLSKNTVKETYKRIAVSSIAWALGYLLMWAGKWVVSSILTGNNTFSEAFWYIKHRLSGDATAEGGVDSNSILEIIKVNVNHFNSPSFWLILFIGIIFTVIILVYKKYKIEVNKSQIMIKTLIGCYPIFWYSIVRNHSAIHSFFTHRSLVVSIFAILLIISYSITSLIPLQTIIINNTFFVPCKLFCYSYSPTYTPKPLLLPQEALFHKFHPVPNSYPLPTRSKRL